MKQLLNSLIKVYVLHCWFLCTGYSQGMEVSTNTHLVVNGNAHLVVKDGRFINNGIFQSGNGTVTLLGSASAANSAIGGDSISVFHNLKINKNNNGSPLTQNIQVDNELQMSDGYLDLNGFNLTLGSAAGQIQGETSTAFITGTNGGEIIKTLNVNAPNNLNPGNIGASITSSANLGNTTVRRGHSPQMINGTSGVRRYYNISPTNNSNLNASLRLTYFDHELNGLVEANLEPWRNKGAYWENYPVNSSDAATNYVETTNIDSFSLWTLGHGSLKLLVKAFLEGPYNTTNTSMNDALRTGGALPTTEPYTALNYTLKEGIGSSTSSAVLSTTGNNAIVDWLMLELRDASNPTVIVTSCPVLLQRDGDIVGLDGTSEVRFSRAAAASYYLVLKHRNHLGIMSANPIALNGQLGALIDFSDPNMSVYTLGTSPPLKSENGVMLLWAGDANGDGTINATDTNTEWRPQNGQPYIYMTSKADMNMDGTVNAVDINLFWRINNSKQTQLPSN